MKITKALNLQEALTKLLQKILNLDFIQKALTKLLYIKI